MPIIAIFYGIIIRMNYNEHDPPHFHAEYQGFRAAFEIKSGNLVAGEFPKNAEKLVKKWAKKYETDLLANWKKVKKHEALKRIPGLE